MAFVTLIQRTVFALLSISSRRTIPMYLCTWQAGMTAAFYRLQTGLPLGGWGVDHWQVPGRMPGMSPMQSMPSPHGPTNMLYGLQRSCGPFAQAMQQPSHLVKFPCGQLSGSGPQSTFSHGCLQVGSAGDEQQIGMRQSTEKHIQLHGFLPLHCFSVRTYMITPTNSILSISSVCKTL